MAAGYNHELLKSDAEMLEEVEQAVGGVLTYHPGPHPSQGEKRDARPAA
jgi:hypothetical protein